MKRNQDFHVQGPLNNCTASIGGRDVDGNTWSNVDPTINNDIIIFIVPANGYYNPSYPNKVLYNLII